MLKVIVGLDLVIQTLNIYYLYRRKGTGVALMSSHKIDLGYFPGPYSYIHITVVDRERFTKLDFHGFGAYRENFSVNF